MGVNSIRYNGLVHKKAIDIRPTKDNKGILLVTKNISTFSLSHKTFSAKFRDNKWSFSLNYSQLRL